MAGSTSKSYPFFSFKNRGKHLLYLLVQKYKTNGFCLGRIADERFELSHLHCLAYRYLGLFTDEIEAAEAYDRASVESKGLRAITNFDISRYLDLLSKRAASEDVLIPEIDHTESSISGILGKKLPEYDDKTLFAS